MTLYRIAKAKHARNAFSGFGAKLAGGRWNFPGEAVVYCSSSLALAALETFTHIGEEGRALSFVSFEADLPDKLLLQLGRPPKNWRAEPPGDITMLVGSKWLAQGRSMAIAVPSVLIPSERNILLNPAHPEFRKLTISKPAKFAFDPRLWK